VGIILYTLTFATIQDLQEKKKLHMQYCPSERMLADLFTKSLAKEWFLELTDSLRIR